MDIYWYYYRPTHKDKNKKVPSYGHLLVLLQTYTCANRKPHLSGRVDEKRSRHIGTVALVPRSQRAENDVVAEISRVTLGTRLVLGKRGKIRNTSRTYSNDPHARAIRYRFTIPPS